MSNETPTPKPMTEDEKRRMRLVNAQVASALTLFADRLNQAFQQKVPEAQVALALVAWPMLHRPGETTPDGRPAFVAEGNAMMVGNVNPNTDPDGVMKAMLESAIKQLSGGGIMQFKNMPDPTKH